MSMVAAMDLQGSGKIGGMPKRVRLYYSSKRRVDGQGNPEEILFEKRLEAIARKWSKRTDVDFGYTLFETTGETTEEGKQDELAQEQETDERSAYMTVHKRRMHYGDLSKEIIPPERRETTLVYVCGVPKMTDDYVDVLRKVPGMDDKRVLCEKWW